MHNATAKPKVSVIIPTCNRLRYLKQALGSVLDQTFKEFEVIIVDGLSKDGTSKYIESLIKQDERFRYFYGKNSCPSAMNKGIEEAKGKYIAFLDDDDFWLPNSLKNRVEFLEKNPNIDMVFANTIEFKGDDPESYKLNYKKNSFFIKQLNACVIKNIFYLLMVNSNFIPTITVMVHRNVFTELGYFDEDLIYNEDLDMWLRIAAYYKIAALPEILAYRRWHNEMTSSNQIKMFIYLEKILEKNYIKFAKKLLNKRQLLKIDSYFARVYFLAGWTHLCEGNKKTAKSYFIKSLHRQLCFSPLFYLTLTCLPSFIFQIMRKVKAKLKLSSCLGPDHYERFYS